MISKNVFFNLCLEALKEHFDPNTYEIRVEKMNKNNVIQTGIIVMQKNKSELQGGPILYPDQYYVAIKSEAEVNGALSRICKLAEDALERYTIEDIVDMKEQFMQPKCLRIAVANYETNQKWLAQCPHKRFADLAVYVRSVCENQNGTMTSCKITDDIARAMNLRKEELFFIAEENTKRLKKFLPLESVMSQMTPMDETSEKLSPIPMYLLSTTEDQYSAGIIACANFLKEVYNELGTGLYILPSSIHEVLCIPAPMNTEFGAQLKNMVWEINRTVLDPEDILTDQVYYFDGSKMIVI